ncbi:hypothetical protein AZJ17_11020, partial [Streptococcus pneumoniae]
TQMKAAANNDRNSRQEFEAQANGMSEQLDKETAQDGIAHGKMPLKPAITGEAKTKKMSMTAKLSLPFSQS